MQLNLHLLRIFFAVAEQRSYTRAAEKLCITQPAVSKAMREIEYQLNLPLIERGGGTQGIKGVCLTDSGQALFEHARGIFALERGAIEDIQARVGLAKGRLVIGASTTIAGYWLPVYVAQFLRDFPSIELKIVVGNTQAMSHALIDCQIDMAFVEGSVADARITAIHWRDDKLAMIAHPDAAITPHHQPSMNELNQHVWLVREQGSGTLDVSMNVMEKLGIQPAHCIEMGSNEGIARAVAAGAGIALLPKQVVQELILLGAVKELNFVAADMLNRPLFLLQLKERPASPLMRAFCESVILPM